jgi:UDP-hydrolysing UDP-N-acetyl-D-glucosamine 2-epimerase
MTRKTIAVFTGNRAEYGLQYPILAAVRAHPALDYRLIVSGAHLDPNFGRTIEEIRGDGFEISAEVAIDMAEDTAAATARAIGSGILSVSRALETLQPDFLVVYADRFEGFAAMIAGTQMNIPTAHIEGGDVTEGGALDDSVRHAMTKLAHLHFTTNRQATERVLAMGEEPWRVRTVGFPAIDLIAAGGFTPAAAVDERLGLDPARPVALFTQHSITTEIADAPHQATGPLTAMRRLADEGVQVILTYPNNDAGGRSIIALLQDIAAAPPPGVQVWPSLGRRLYHGVLALARDPARRVVCIGNSSSGIKETPAFGCPTVNIGSRQLGRLRAGNVLDAGYDAASVYAAARRCLDDDDFRRFCRGVENPYGVGDAGRKIADCLADPALDRARLLRKGMTLRGGAV